MLHSVRARAYAGGVLTVGALVAAAMPSNAAVKPKLGPNLLPNASFEKSVIDPAGEAAKQPVLPTGWVFEGAAGLFDHGEHGSHSGKRAAGISDPMTTPTEVCQQKQCVSDPAAATAAGARGSYSEMPAWRNQSAVAVKAGKTYQLSAWVNWTLETVGTGAVTYVRWVNASGSSVGVSAGPAKLADVHNSGSLAWTQVTGKVKAPAGATGAIVLLGDSDGGWISSLQYDDAYFGQLGK